MVDKGLERCDKRCRTIFSLRPLSCMRVSYTPRRIAFIFLILANPLCLVLYLYYASWIWAAPEEQGLYGGPGDPIIWGLSALPWLAAGAFVNIVVIPIVATDLFRHKNVRLFLMWCTFVLVWISAIAYDSSRQYNGSLVSEDRFAPGASAHGPPRN